MPEIGDQRVPLAVAAAEVMLATGNVAEAADWVRDRGLTVDDEPAYPRDEAYVVLARVLIATGDPGSGGADAGTVAGGGGGAGPRRPRARRSGAPGRGARGARGRARRIGRAGQARSLSPRRKATSGSSSTRAPWWRTSCGRCWSVGDWSNLAGARSGAARVPDPPRRGLRAARHARPARGAVGRGGGAGAGRAAEQAGAGGARAGRGGQAQPGDRRRAVHRPGHRQAARQPPLRQAGRHQPHRGRRPTPAAPRPARADRAGMPPRCHFGGTSRWRFRAPSPCQETDGEGGGVR